MTSKLQGHSTISPGTPNNLGVHDIFRALRALEMLKCQHNLIKERLHRRRLYKRVQTAKNRPAPAYTRTDPFTPFLIPLKNSWPAWPYGKFWNVQNHAGEPHAKTSPPFFPLPLVKPSAYYYALLYPFTSFSTHTDPSVVFFDWSFPEYNNNLIKYNPIKYIIYLTPIFIYI